MEKSVRPWIDGWRKLRRPVYETAYTVFPTGWRDLVLSPLISFSLSHSPTFVPPSPFPPSEFPLLICVKLKLFISGERESEGGIILLRDGAR